VLNRFWKYLFWPFWVPPLDMEKTSLQLHLHLQLQLLASILRLCLCISAARVYCLWHCWPRCVSVCAGPLCIWPLQGRRTGKKGARGACGICPWPPNVAYKSWGLALAARQFVAPFQATIVVMRPAAGPKFKDSHKF